MQWAAAHNISYSPMPSNSGWKSSIKPFPQSTLQTEYLCKAIVPLPSEGGLLVEIFYIRPFPQSMPQRRCLFTIWIDPLPSEGGLLMEILYKTFSTELAVSVYTQHKRFVLPSEGRWWWKWSITRTCAWPILPWSLSVLAWSLKSKSSSVSQYLVWCWVRLLIHGALDRYPDSGL